MPRQRIPLVGSPINRSADANAFTSYDQRFVNCYPEITRNQVTGQGSVALFKRLGMQSSGSIAASYVGTPGMITWMGKSDGLSFVCPFLNGTALRLYDRDSALIGGAAVTAHTTGFLGGVRISETLISNVSTLVIIARESATGRPYGWYYTEGGGAWAEITDADFPPNQGTPLTIVGNAVHMDGYMFVMDSAGRIWNSDLNSVTTWTATSFISAAMVPDGGVGLARTGAIIWAFGTNSIEPFQNAGNATGSPLTRITSGSKRIGAIRTKAGQPETIYQVNDSVYFIGTSTDGAMKVYQIDGGAIAPVSNAAINKLMQSDLAENVVWGITGAFQMHGMSHLMFYRGTTVQVPCYCIDTKTWWYFEHGNSYVMCGAAGIADSTQGVAYSAMQTQTNSGTSGNKIYTIISSTAGMVNQDAVNDSPFFYPFTMTAQTQPLDHGTNRKKFFTSAEVICDSQTTSGDISISWSDDDYATFSTARTIDPSTGQKRITRLGSTQRRYNNKRAWKITETVNRPFRGEAIDIEYEVGET